MSVFFWYLSSLRISAPAKETWSLAASWVILIAFCAPLAGQDSKGFSILEFRDGEKSESQSNRGAALTSSPTPKLIGPKPSYRSTVSDRAPQFLNSRSQMKPSPTGSLPHELAAEATDASEELNQLITQMVLDNIPHTFEENKDWGGTSARFNGFSLRENRLRAKSKEVNHGTWKRYSATLIKPETGFSIEIKNLRELPDASVGFAIHCVADVAIEGRQAKWVKGVQLYSVSAKGHARIGILIDLEIAVTTDPQSFPPDLVFHPVAKAADLTIEEFRIDRVSKAGGEFAQQVSKTVRSKLDERIEKEEKKLLEKINKKIAEKQNRFRISVSDAMQSKWFVKAKQVLPASLTQRDK